MLLELMLPAGRGANALVLGSACPPRLRPVATGHELEGPVDLAVLAPTEVECADGDWLEDAMATCADRLSPDGLVYALVPRRWRSRVRTRMQRRGLSIESAILHLPDVVASQQLIPLEPSAAKHAFASIVPLVPWKRAAIGGLLSLGAGRVVSSGLENVALVARRKGSRPLFDWLAVPGVPAGAKRSAVLSAAWRADGASVVLHPFGAGASPPVVAKLRLGPTATPREEESRLTRLGPDAARAGAAIPQPLSPGDLNGAPVLIETRVNGRIQAPLLGRRPARLAEALARVCTWLDAWQRLTATTGDLTRRRLEHEVLAPAEILAPHLDGGTAYLAALNAKCAAVTGRPVPLVATHNDLTMWNVLVDRGGRLGIVDWEAADDASLPLKDFFYAVVDAVAATNRYADRPGAVRACFDPDGEHADRVTRLQASLASGVRAAPEIVDLSFHACWLGHAADELGKIGAADPTPFCEIVQWLAGRSSAAP